MFHVQGSAEDPYEVAFVIDDTNATVTCTCAAGQNGQHCKHRIGIIVGAIDNVAEVSGTDAEQLRELSTLLPNTDVWPAVQRFFAAEDALESAKTERRRAARALARAFED